MISARLGAGWFEKEHRSLGFEFKRTAQRLRALDEACQIIDRMLTGGVASLKGTSKKRSAAHVPFRPPRPRLMIAGAGEKVLLKIVAEHADMWNTQGSPERMSRLIDVMRRHCDAIGRDVDEIEKTVAIPFCYRADKSREDDAIRMAAALGRVSPEQARSQMMIGEKQECLDKIERYFRIGATHFLFVSVRRSKVDEVRRFAEEVIPEVR